MEDRGVLYIAYGDKARAQAKTSIETVRRCSPGLPIAVISDEPLGDTEHIYQPDEDRGARYHKTRIYELSPFEKTLFLDADTEMLSSPEPGFRLLQWVDVVLTQDPNRIFSENSWPHLIAEEMKATKEEIGTDEHMYFNSGVIFFKRNERTEAMMKAWHEEWQRWGKHDQMALLRAIHRCPVQIAPMRHPWNTHKKREAEFIYHKHRQARREGAPQ